MSPAAFYFPSILALTTWKKKFSGHRLDFFQENAATVLAAAVELTFQIEKNAVLHATV